MTSAATVAMYYLGEAPPLRIAELHREPTGSIRVVVLDTPAQEKIRQLLANVGLYRLQRGVTPDEGELYIEAARESLGRSIYSFVDEPALGGNGGSGPAGRAPVQWRPAVRDRDLFT